jgi:hypothetical protein
MDESGCGLAHSITQPARPDHSGRRLDKERIVMIGVHRHRVGESGFKEKKDGEGKEKKRGLNPDIPSTYSSPTCYYSTN